MNALRARPWALLFLVSLAVNLFLGGMLLWKRIPLRRGSLSSKFTVWLILGHLVALGIYGILAIGGFFMQHVTWVLVYFGLSALLLYCLTLYLTAFRWRELLGRR